MAITKEELDLERRERLEDMLEMRNQGMSLQTIGDKYGITRERVRQLVGPAKKPVHSGFETHEAYLLYSRFIASLFEGGDGFKDIRELTGIYNSTLRKMAIDGGYVFPKRNSELIEEGLRRCCRCHIVKPLKDFGKDSKSKSGLSRSCRTCNSSNTRAYYQKRKAPKAHVE